MELRDASVAGLPFGYLRNIRICHHSYILWHKTREQSVNHYSLKKKKKKKKQLQVPFDF